uniref:Zinc finger protein 699-like n=1 Tax=Hirondellea gigas TaxID=1518452 RepID=A0A2P2I473_9CRUS
MVEWYSPCNEEMSIVAEILDNLDDHVELNITEDLGCENTYGSNSYIKTECQDTDTITYDTIDGTHDDDDDEINKADDENRIVLARKRKKQSHFRKGFIAFDATRGVLYEEPSKLISESNSNGKSRKNTRKRKIRGRKIFTKKLNKALRYEQQHARVKLEEDDDGVFYPVKIAARKVLNKQHFDQFFLDKEKIFLEENLNELTCVKSEILSSHADGFIEMCEVTDGNGYSSVELKYGSGISIYESLQADDSDTETKQKTLGIDSLNVDENRLHKCTKCAEEFFTKKSLSEHKASVHKRQTSFFKCYQCGAVYKRAYKYHCHVGGHDGRFCCNQCQKTFVRLTGYKKHLRQCHKVPSPNICVVCGQYFLSHEKLDCHLVESHPAESHNLRAYYKQCTYCRYQFLTELSYVNHQKNAPYKCNDCDITFECNNKLGFHTNFKHKPQMCDYCGKHFDAFDQYTYHVRYYHTDKHIKCPYCDEKFRVRSRLLIHIDVNHTEGHNYKCNQCEYTAKNYASVNRHRRIVHMPKTETHKHVCNVCGKSFLVLSRLKVHLKSHSDAKPHVCQMCGRGYKFEYLLKRHQRNPDFCIRVLFPNGTRLERKGKRRCDMCDLGFSSPDQLAVHMIATHNVKIESKDVIPTRFAESIPSDNIDPHNSNTGPASANENIVNNYVSNGVMTNQELCKPKLNTLANTITVASSQDIDATPNNQSHVSNLPTIINTAKYVSTKPASIGSTGFSSSPNNNHSFIVDYVGTDNVQILNIPYDKSDDMPSRKHGDRPIISPSPVIAIEAHQIHLSDNTAVANQWQAQQQFR